MTKVFNVHFLFIALLVFLFIGCTKRPPTTETEQTHMAEIEKTLYSISDTECVKFKCRYLLEMNDATYVFATPPFSPIQYNRQQKPLPDTAAMKTPFRLLYPGEAHQAMTAYKVLRLRDVTKVIPLDGSKESTKAALLFLLQ